MASLLFETSFGQGSTNETPTWLDGLLFRYHLIQDLLMICLNIKWTVQAIPAIDRCTFPIISTLPGLPLRASDVHKYYIITSSPTIACHGVAWCISCGWVEVSLPGFANYFWTVAMVELGFFAVSSLAVRWKALPVNQRLLFCPSALGP